MSCCINSFVFVQTGCRTRETPLLAVTLIHDKARKPRRNQGDTNLCDDYNFSHELPFQTHLPISFWLNPNWLSLKFLKKSVGLLFNKKRLTKMKNTCTAGLWIFMDKH